jgi:hypothetical protein
MDTWIASASAVLGILIRLGIPLALTVLLVNWQQGLDRRWQEEAKREVELQKVKVPLASNTGCWNLKGCSEESKAKCQAFRHQEVPCWQLFRSPKGLLQEKCIGCQVFKEAPVPVLI